jgi:hypothetical protein
MVNVIVHQLVKVRSGSWVKVRSGSWVKVRSGSWGYFYLEPSLADRHLSNQG